MPKHCKNQGLWAVGASSFSCQKESHEEGSMCPNSIKTKDSEPSGLLLAFVKRNVMRNAEEAQTLQKPSIWGRRGFFLLLSKGTA